MSDPAALESLGEGRYRMSGSWTVHGIAAVEPVLAGLPAGKPIAIDASGLAALDTAGAWLLVRLRRACERGGIGLEIGGFEARFRELYELVERAPEPAAESRPARPPLLEAVGRSAVEHARQSMELLGFLGETIVTMIRTWRHPRLIRWRPLLAVIEGAGVEAIPIVGLLSFLIGVVLAYQGGVQLKAYGANIFVVDLVALTILRELGPMMTAIIVAGRTGSAYTAEIGTMMVTEEVDALRTMGVSPMELLVLPKLFGLGIALPLLTMLADVLGVIGGMVMASIMLGVDSHDFIARLPVSVSVTSFLIGIGKAPVFAAIIAMVGCFQGFRVTGGAESVGRQTTVSVVQAIFLVIVTDAAFSVLFSALKI